jgi:hypothetical protein
MAPKTIGSSTLPRRNEAQAFTDLMVHLETQPGHDLEERRPSATKKIAESLQTTAVDEHVNA